MASYDFCPDTDGEEYAFLVGRVSALAAFLDSEAKNGKDYVDIRLRFAMLGVEQEVEKHECACKKKQENK